MEYNGNEILIIPDYNNNWPVAIITPSPVITQHAFWDVIQTLYCAASTKERQKHRAETENTLPYREIKCKAFKSLNGYRESLNLEYDKRYPPSCQINNLILKSRHKLFDQRDKPGWLSERQLKTIKKRLIHCMLSGIFFLTGWILDENFSFLFQGLQKSFLTISTSCRLWLPPFSNGFFKPVQKSLALPW